MSNFAFKDYRQPSTQLTLRRQQVYKTTRQRVAAALCFAENESFADGCAVSYESWALSGFAIASQTTSLQDYE